MAGSNLDNKPDLIVYPLDENGDVISWDGIGVAWKNSKGGAKVILDELPQTTKLLLLPRRGEVKA